MNLLNIEHIHKVFGEKVIFDDVSFGVHEGDKIGIIAVNCGDDAGTVKDFVEENGYTFPVVLDEEYSISMLYPTNSIPYTVVVDAEGKVTHISTGALDADTMYERYKEALGV